MRSPKVRCDAWAHSPEASGRTEDAWDGRRLRRSRLAVEARAAGHHAARAGASQSDRAEGSLAQRRERMRKILPSYLVSQRRRKMVEEVIDWVKTVGLFRRVCQMGRKRIAHVTKMTMAACNIVQMSSLLAN